MAESEQLNVKDWITLSSVMIGAVLTILALIWQEPPAGNKGIVTSTFLLMISFIFFVNSVSTNSKANYEARSGKTPEKKINQWVRFAEYSFGFGFTLVICGFSLLGYAYLMGFTSGAITALLLPLTYIVITLIIVLIYNTINSGNPFGNMKRNLWAMLEVLFVILICIDYFTAFSIL